jgi:gamma-glutamyltranspeptidase/glutathione hydrolase
MSELARRAGRTMYGTRGAAATSHPLAAQAGEELLRAGGTAVDAAVGMAAALTVVEPTSNGLGSDAFALVWAEGRLHGLNGSGRSPAALTLESLRDAGHDAMPTRGWWSVTVPGAPAAWADLHARFGKLPFERVLEPAILLAEEGHPVAPVVAAGWDRGGRVFGALEEPEFRAWRETFLPRGRAPRVGERVRLADHARTLRALAASRCRDFYEGDLARAIDAFARETGGLLRAGDLAAHRSDWAEPLSVRYRDVEVWELPPNGQGIVALAALGILDGLPAGSAWDDPAGVHASIEAIKLAFADAQRHVADPACMEVDSAELLDAAYLERRRSELGSRAETRVTGLPQRGGTVFLVAADGDGMMVSFIQSNYMGFGSGVVVPGTGIALQNRGAGFTTEAGHPNVVAAGKRPFHTIIPGFLTRDGAPWGPFGVMGGHMQPQGHLQVVRALVDFGLGPQAALDLPRWRWTRDLAVDMECGWSRETVSALRTRGHVLEPASDVGPFGRGQIILRGADGVLAAGSDRRADGQALVW